eukprot:1644569-Amphidinium_carterae.1
MRHSRVSITTTGKGSHSLLHDSGLRFSSDNGSGLEWVDSVVGTQDGLNLSEGSSSNFHLQ